MRGRGRMREEQSSETMEPPPIARSSSPPPTTAASSVGASSPAVPANFNSIDWLGHGQGSKAASLSGSPVPWTSMSTSACESALGMSRRSCRPWERGDLLRRLATFKPSNWSGKPKVASSLACARRGWVSVDIDKVSCESCGANLSFTILPVWAPSEVDSAGEAFAKQLDLGHKVSCPWKGNSCAESLVQFPPTPLSALIGGYKDRCDALSQFLSLPVIASSVIEKMRLSRSAQIDRLLSQPQILAMGEFCSKADSIPGPESREEATYLYSLAQKLISLCGWEARWLPNVVDCEEHSAQSTRNACSVGPTRDPLCPSQEPGSSKNRAKKDTGKKKISVTDQRPESRSSVLDCSLCGATVRLWNFLAIPRPTRFAPIAIDIPETSKKLTRGVSAASGINGWVAADGIDKEQTEGRDDAATTDEGKSPSNVGVDLNLTIAGGLNPSQFSTPTMPGDFNDAARFRDPMIRQPSGSEVGDRAASYESRGPRTRKRSLEEGGSTVDRPQDRMHADSVEGTVIDRDGDEVNDGRQCSSGPSKRVRDSHISQRGDISLAGPSHAMGYDVDTEVDRVNPFRQEDSEHMVGMPSARDSARASSVIAMDTLCHGEDEDSMESVENYPGDVTDVNFQPFMYRNQEMNDVSELNPCSVQAQQSGCNPPISGRVAEETGLSSTDEGEETLNAENVAVEARGGTSIGISGGSFGMAASHEAEIHGTDAYIHRADSTVGEAEPVAGVIENQGQSGEFGPDPGLMDEFVPEEIYRDDGHGDNQDMMSHSVGRVDSGSKYDGSTKAESLESAEKISQTIGRANSDHRSLTNNAMIFSGYEVSKEEVTKAGKQSRPDDCTFLESEYVAGNGNVHGESNYEADVAEFDPIHHHHHFCPWVNGNVAAAGCNSSTSSGNNAVALCGWQLTLDALDACQSLDVPIQTVESESAASLYKDDHLTPVQKLLGRHSVSRSHGQL
ncbi:uncharacterized protein LOC18427229 isoform X1 [Amborella trichopoda]|nr:uncharacterized protein LOC18427229 isoform X1 [Amborella trichopoda]XP_020518599.1 uncharacterized protein LOC18427229 isoform X1 [Amborella trichopoda]|eukprot:XP_006836346.2 uncharacterized protein LOC18427229 isoform X1 [Amborella trichopoda]